MTATHQPTDPIARELEQLGEAPLDADERAMLAREHADDDPEIASTEWLFRVAEPVEEAGQLSDLDQQRVWRTIEQRRRHREGRRWAPWIAGVIAIAAAAVLVIVVIPESEPAGPSADEVAEVGDQVRSTLRVLDDGLDDTTRAERLTADYQRRLEEGT